MKVEEMNKPAVLLIEAAGLLITAALLFVIAVTLKLSLGLVTLGVVLPDLGVLAFGFLYWVCAAFVSTGTRGRPAHPSFVLSNLALHAGFLAAAWLLWRPALPASWLGYGVALCATVHAAVCLMARFRVRLIDALLRWPAARPAATVESVFQAYTAPYRAIPFGAAVGALLGTLAQAPEADRVRHIAAGVFAALALDAARRLALGGAGLAGDLVSAAEVTRVEARRLNERPTDPLRVLIPMQATAQAQREAAGVAAAVRRVLLANQLPRVMVMSLGALVVAQLELPGLALGPLAASLLALALLATFGCFLVGQRATNRQLPADPGGHEPAPSAFAPVAAGLAVAAALAVGLLAGRVALLVTLPLVR